MKYFSYLGFLQALAHNDTFQSLDYDDDFDDDAFDEDFDDDDEFDDEFDDEDDDWDDEDDEDDDFDDDWGDEELEIEQGRDDDWCWYQYIQEVSEPSVN